MVKTTVLALAVLAAAGVATAEGAGGYTLRDLGAFYTGNTGGFFNTPGGSTGKSINNAGQVVGNSTVKLPDGSFTQTAFLYDPVKGMQDLGLSGYASSYALGLNNNGQVVGYVQASPYETHAFVWDATHGMQLLPYVSAAYPGYPGGSQSLNATAVKINDNGMIVGDSTVYSADAYQHPHATVTWDTKNGNAVTDLTNYMGTTTLYPVSYGTGINARGDIAGYSTGMVSGIASKDWAGIELKAQSGGGYQTVGIQSASGQVAVYTTAIDAKGRVIGSTPYSTATTGDDQWEGAFVWDPATSTMKKLGKAGYTFSHAYGLNGSGVIVGDVQNFANTPVRFNDVSSGVVWDPTTGIMYKLTDLVANSTGYHINSATGVNDSGQIIATATNAQGAIRAVVLHPLSANGLPVALTGGTVDSGAYRKNGVTELGLGSTGLAASQKPTGATVELTNLALTGSFATLQVSYDPADLAVAGLAEDAARLYWYNTTTSAWVLAGDAANDVKNPGAHFVAGAPDSVLGDWGVDTTNHVVWANVDHASTYGVVSTVPEPGSLGLLGVGVAGLLWRRRK